MVFSMPDVSPFLSPPNNTCVCSSAVCFSPRPSYKEWSRVWCPANCFPSLQQPGTWDLPVMFWAWPATPKLVDVRLWCWEGLGIALKIKGPLSWRGDLHRENPGPLVRSGKWIRQEDNILPAARVNSRLLLLLLCLYCYHDLYIWK